MAFIEIFLSNFNVLDSIIVLAFCGQYLFHMH